MFEVEGFSLMTLVTIMEFILLSLCEVDIGGVNNINTKIMSPLEKVFFLKKYVPHRYFQRG